MPIIIDDFEDGNLTEWTITGNYNGTPEAVTTKPYNGSYSLHLQTTSGSANNPVLESSSGLNYYPKPGDTFEFWLWDEHGNDGYGGASLFHWGTDSNNYFTINPRQGKNDILLSKTVGGTGTQLDSVSVTLNAQVWRRFKIEWGSGGSITVTVYDTSNNVVATLSGTESSIGSGWIKINAWSGLSTWDSYFDYIHKVVAAGPPTRSFGIIIPR